MKKTIKKIVLVLYKCIEPITRNVANIIKEEKELTFKKDFLIFGEESYIDLPNDIAGRDSISIGNHTRIQRNARFLVSCLVDGAKTDEPIISIGDYCYIACNFTILACKKITIEENVLIANDVFICDYNHGMDVASKVDYMYQTLKGEEIRIGRGTWVGEKVCILKGVEIGKQCIIGCGSVVTKSIPDYCIVAGNPARIIKRWDNQAEEWTNEA